MHKKQNRQKKTTRFLLAIVVVLLALLGAMMVMLHRWPARSEPIQTNSGTAAAESAQEIPAGETQLTEEFQPIDLGQGLLITTVGKYAGMFVEDGTNEVVTDTLMVILENTSEEALQYAQITFHYEHADAVFSVTNLPAGKKAVLLEQNRMAFTQVKPEGFSLENVVFLESFPLYEDIFQITGADSCLNVRNISEQKIDGDIYVYYKNAGGDMYYGGITYRIRIEGGLAPNEIRQVMTAHYDPDNSEIVMVTYGT